MFWLLGMLLLAYALCLEVTLQADLRHGEETQARVILSLADIHKTWRLALVKTPRGHRLVLADEYGSRPLDAGQLRQSRGTLLLDSLRRADKARGFLLRHTCLDCLNALILLRTEDAARSALLTGAVQGLLCSIPAVRRRQIHIRVLPEFFRGHSTVNARCIIRLRLGTILLTAMMLLLAWLREQRLTESEAA